MATLKRFYIYIVLLVAFFIVSIFLENGLLKTMYSKIPGEFDGYDVSSGKYFSVEIASGKACNVNGYIQFDLYNTTGKYVEKCYAKVELYNTRNLLADTEYLEILDMESGSSRKYNIKFQANHIQKYRITIVSEAPDTTNKVNILGWDVDLTNVFGYDLSNTKIFGMKLTDVLKLSNAKSTATGFLAWIKFVLMGVPAWAYAFAWLFYVGLL